jgi:hypothetical protein
LPLVALAAAPVAAQELYDPDTLDRAIADAYRTNPTLEAGRAQLRVLDEQIVQAGSPYRLTVYENERSMVRTLDDPFCGPYGPYPRAYYRGGWGSWYGPGYGWNGWGCSPPRVQSYTVREMTWVLTRQGDSRALWSATARETSPRGPALELARKLAAGLALAPTH